MQMQCSLPASIRKALRLTTLAALWLCEIRWTPDGLLRFCLVARNAPCYFPAVAVSPLTSA
jgi:hypothetical protein